MWNRLYPDSNPPINFHDEVISPIHFYISMTINLHIQWGLHQWRSPFFSVYFLDVHQALGDPFPKACSSAMYSDTKGLNSVK